MTIADYQPFVERMIERYEGGYGWNHHDPGGPTKYGITCYDLAEHHREEMNSMVEWAPLVREMTLQEADEIYKEKYASACAFNALNAGKDCVVFDFGVNSGPSRAVKYAQRVTGVTVDGILGPNTLKAINNADPHSFIENLCDARLGFLHGLGTWPVFGSGWAARVVDLRHYSLDLAYPAKKLTPDIFADKPQLIPLAFGKAYDLDDLPARYN